MCTAHEIRERIGVVLIRRMACRNVASMSRSRCRERSMATDAA